MEKINKFLIPIYKRMFINWMVNKFIIGASFSISFYLFWLFYNRFFYMTTLEWFLFPLTLISPFFYSFRRKPSLLEVVEFLENKLQGLEGRLYLLIDPYPSIFDSSKYKKRAVEEAYSILRKINIKELVPIKIGKKSLMSLILLSIIAIFFYFQNIILIRISEKPSITYLSEVAREEGNTLVLARSNQLKKMYAFYGEEKKKMFNFGNGKFGVILNLEKTTEIQVGYRIWKSEKRKIEVFSPLLLRKLILTYQFPSYLGKRPFSDTLYKIEKEIFIQALEGTKIVISGEANVEIGKLEGEVFDKSISGKNFYCSFVLKEKEEKVLNLRDCLELFSYSLRFLVEPIKDEPPYVEFLYPKGEYKLGESMEVPIILNAEDDYGLRSISLLYGKDKIRIKIPEGSKMIVDSTVLAIENLPPGDTIKLKAIAIDFAGNKTFSQPVFIYMPTLEEIFAKYRNLSDSAIESTSDFEDKSKEMVERIEDFLYKGYHKPEDQIELRKTLQTQRDIIEGVEKLVEFTEKIKSPEISREIENIREILNNKYVKEFLNALEKLIEKKEFSPEELKKLTKDQKELLESLEIFKKSLEYLKSLLEISDFSKRAEEIYEEQKEITQGKPSDSLSPQEEKLAQELEKLLQEMRESKNSEIKKLASDFKETMTIENMKKLAEFMKEGKMDKEIAKNIEENLRNLNLSLNSLRNSKFGEEVKNLIRKKGWELCFVLNTHNELIERRHGIEKALIELGLSESIDRIEKELKSIFLKSLSFSPEVFKDLQRAKEKMRALSEELKVREVPRTSMERVNDLIIQAILKLFSPPGGGKSLAGALKELIEEQSAILNELNKMSLLPVPTSGGESYLKELAEKQRQLAQKLEEMGSAFGPLSDEMKEMAESLEKGFIDKEIIERQRKVLDRLLEAERSIREGDLSTRRYSEPGIFVAPERVKLPENLGEEKKRLRELLKKRIEEEPYPYEYKKEIEDYFRRLIE
ncbi:MAG: hypothetical protein ABIN61_04080 [candidate division WOR-3 bacterium]